MDRFMSEIKFTDQEKIRLKELAAMDNLYPRALVKGGLLDWCVSVCKFYEITVPEFRSKKRDRILFKARVDFTHIILKHSLKYNQNEIAKFMNRHHTTIIHQKKEDPFAAETIWLENATR
tara:strand:+ start:641 stop:1000 length:360 start_codon:yes stop_codon:yes gene_type:complete